MHPRTKRTTPGFFQRAWREEKAFLAAIPSIAFCYFMKHTDFVGEAGSFGALNDFFLVFSFVIIVWNAMAISRHAEKLAERLGEPYGTMILTLSAITVEVIMVITMMSHGA